MSFSGTVVYILFHQIVYQEPFSGRALEQAVQQCDFIAAPSGAVLIQELCYLRKTRLLCLGQAVVHPCLSGGTFACISLFQIIDESTSVCPRGLQIVAVFRSLISTGLDDRKVVIDHFFSITGKKPVQIIIYDAYACRRALDLSITDLALCRCIALCTRIFWSDLLTGTV